MCAARCQRLSAASAGNWTAYWPNELVCDVCSTCDSPLSNQVSGHSFIRLDDGTYARCDNPDDGSWWNASVASRAAGAKCTYSPPCLEWTGQRPYSNPQLGLGTGVVSRAVPSGRYAHGAALVLNRVTGERDTMVLFGGYSTDCTDYCNDTWHYSVPYNLWSTPNSMGAAPARRWKHAMTDYLDSVFLFGGHGMRRPPPLSEAERLPNEVYDTGDVYNPLQPLLFDDLWEYNVTRATRAGASWTKRTPTCITCTPGALEADGTPVLDLNGPRPRHSASLVTHGDALYMFGGYAFGGKSAYAVLYPTGEPDDYPSLETKYYRNDLWRYNISANTWAQITPATAALPPPRAGHAAAVSLRDGEAVMVVFGGTTWDDQVGDAWQFNFSSRAWNRITGDGTFPSRRTALLLTPVGQSSTTLPGTGPQSGRLLLATGHGCLKGATYSDASKSSVAHTVSSLGAYSGYDTSLSRGGNGSIRVFGSYVDAATGETVYADAPDLWVETSAEYGEKYCVDELDDAWEYSPAACPADCNRHGPCSFNACICDAGFWGADCSNVTCPSSSCAFNYVDRRLDCVFCNARGTCNGILGTCSCVFPASGPGCDAYACLNGCSGHGVCDTATANAQGYGTCTVRGGSCARSGSARVCAGAERRRPCAQCEEGYEGSDCGTSVCVSNPSEGASQESCSGNGVCVGGECQCFPGFGDRHACAGAAPSRRPADSPPACAQHPVPGGQDGARYARAARARLCKWQRRRGLFLRGRARLRARLRRRLRQPGVCAWRRGQGGAAQRCRAAACGARVDDAPRRRRVLRLRRDGFEMDND